MNSRHLKSMTGIMLFSIILFSCEKDNGTDEVKPIAIKSLSGLVQKGPFMNGTAITAAELNASLGQTGKTFTTQISDNLGSFALHEIELSTQFVELRADGFFFNEVTGSPSTARLYLKTLSDLTDKATLNVNLLSHLESGRIQFLYSGGASFADAKKQAQQDVLGLFSIAKSNMLESELLDISQNGEDHAILLALSVILQGHRSVAELTELVANISSDIREDGELTDLSLGSELLNHAVHLNLTHIREALEDRYMESGLQVTLPAFETYVESFIANSGFELTEQIEYPEFSAYGENILFGEKDRFMGHKDYSMAANLPPGSHVSVRLSGGKWYYNVLPNGPVNWKVSEYDHEAKTQLFSSVESGKACDLIIKFSPPSETTDSTTMQDSIFNKYVLIEYFEDQSITPTRTREIEIESPPK